MFFRNRKKNRNAMSDCEKELIIASSYGNIIKTAEQWLNPVYEKITKSEQIMLLDYMIDSVLDDICTSTVVEPLVSYPNGILQNPFPDYYYDEYGLKHAVATDKERVDITLLYPHIKTNGCDWYNAHTDKKIAPVPDFRFAAVYTLAKMRYNIAQRMA